MDINLGIVDQRLTKLTEVHQDFFVDSLHLKDAARQQAAAFVFLCVKTLFDLTDEDALDCLTEGGDDAGIDAIHVGDPKNDEFTITLFQGKYNQRDDGLSEFGENAIVQVISTLRTLFDPDAKLPPMNCRLLVRVEEVRSLIADGTIPSFRVVLCNNGRIWNVKGRQVIDAAQLPPNQVAWEHMNHNRIVQLLQSQKPINDSIQLAGEAVVEHFAYRRVLVGKLPITELAVLFNRYDNLLLERNIRRYLGNNRVNQNIQESLLSAEGRKNFYFFNNGITAICDKFRHNEGQKSGWKILVENFYIINGGQTGRTIEETLRMHASEDYSQTYVLLRLYELERDQDSDLIDRITYATNNQSQVELHDLRSNDAIQKKLELAVKDLGFEYRRKRDSAGGRGDRAISLRVAAEALLAVWQRGPNKARLYRSSLFLEPHYGRIFNDSVNGAQLILAVQLFRTVETERKRRENPRFLPYASHFLAMLMGQELLKGLGLLRVQDLTHKNFADAETFLDANRDRIYEHAVATVEATLKKSGLLDESLQRLSGAFRGADLLRSLK